MQSSEGLLLFVQYAFMPNRLGYCGGNDNALLFDHAVAGDADPKLAPFLARFTGAFPYLRTIAEANGIADPFDRRVVEAYWIGNGLLERVPASLLTRSLEDRFGSQLTGRVREIVLRKAPEGAKAHHFFHVVDVYRHLEPEIGLTAMDSCRVSWGRVRAVDGPRLIAERRPLELRDGRLALGGARPEEIVHSVDGKGFTASVGPGDWVSIHWGWACEVLDDRKLANLVRVSHQHLEVSNRTI
ncbi:MAG: DUF6390 family protein [Actinomycetota bacterium]